MEILLTRNALSSGGLYQARLLDFGRFWGLCSPIQNGHKSLQQQAKGAQSSHRPVMETTHSLSKNLAPSHTPTLVYTSLIQKLFSNSCPSLSNSTPTHSHVKLTSWICKILSGLTGGATGLILFCELWMHGEVLCVCGGIYGLFLDWLPRQLSGARALLYNILQG